MTLKLLFYTAMLVLAIVGYRHYAGLSRQGLQAGDNAPGFTLQDAQGKTHSLADYAGKYLVIYFYPKDDTPGCTQEACSFRDNISQFEKLGVHVIGISVDDVQSHQRFGDKFQLPFPLLADTDGKVADSYHALNDLILIKIAKRHTYIVDPAGKIILGYQSVDTAKHAQQIISDLKQHIQQH